MHNRLFKTIPIPNRNDKIELYYYSLITGHSPIYIEYKKKDNGKGVLICKSDNISDVNISNDTLTIQFSQNIHRDACVFMELNCVYLDTKLEVIVDSIVGKQSYL
ncbi:MAG: hypothetical protein DI598_02310 [Pseudopedobacter saltans]|uniref:Uncharacterized protein n=1 Tax=Pseudopedobacter saltans TaxID=151895 RepID=A0A2W5F8M9_9SPHI|nr:MAG: hypothetical protein DI598_02310 [Pseudopedobacter saltans]